MTASTESRRPLRRMHNLPSRIRSRLGAPRKVHETPQTSNLTGQTGNASLRVCNLLPRVYRLVQEEQDNISNERPIVTKRVTYRLETSGSTSPVAVGGSMNGQSVVRIYLTLLPAKMAYIWAPQREVRRSMQNQPRFLQWQSIVRGAAHRQSGKAWSGSLSSARLAGQSWAI